MGHSLTRPVLLTGIPMDALYVISGFLGLLIFGQALRIQKREQAQRWWFLAAFGLCHTADSWLILGDLLTPNTPVPPGFILAARLGASIALLAFGVLSLGYRKRLDLGREDLFPIFWLLLIAVACAWGWRDNRWAGLDAVLRHGLVLPAGLLAFVSLLPSLNRGALWQRVVAGFSAFGWLIYALTTGLAVPSDALTSIGLAWSQDGLDAAAWTGSAALMTVWIGLWIPEWHRVPQTARAQSALLWMQPVFLAVAIVLGLLLARWQAEFHLEKFREQAETTVFQFRTALSMQGYPTADLGPEFEALVASHLRDYSPISGERILYTILKEDQRLVFGPSFGQPTRGKWPPAASFSITNKDRAVFERGEAYVAGPNAGGGRFLTAVTPVQDPATGEVIMALGMEINPSEWNQERQTARRVPLIATLVLGLLCLASFSQTIRIGLALRAPHLLMESVAVIAFGVLLTGTAAWVVADRSQTVRTADLQQTATTMAIFLGNQIEQTIRNLEIIARQLEGAPPTQERFLKAWQVTAVSRAHPAWVLIAPDGSVTAVAGPQSEYSAPPVRVGTRFPGIALPPNRVVAVSSPETGHALLAAVPGQPGWRVGATCEPFLMLKIAHGRLGPAGNSIEAALFDLRASDREAVATLPGYAATRGGQRAAAPVFFGDRTWAVWAGLPPTSRWLVAEVALAFLAGAVVTGMTLLVVIYLKRRQRDLEAEVSERTSELRVREAEARDLYERLQRIAAQVPGVVFQLKRSTDGVLSFPYLSEAARHAFGIPAHRLLADAALAFERVDSRDRSRFMTSLEESARDMAPWREEFRLDRPGTGEAWFEGSAIPQRIPDGAVVWSGVLYDITERKRHESELLFRAHFQELLTEMAGSFLVAGTDGIDTTFNHLLERVGTFVGADRAYLFQFNRARRTASNTHEWCAPDVQPQRHHLQDIPFDRIPEVIESQMAGRQFFVPDVSAMAPSEFKSSLQSQNIQSLILLPLINEGDCFGFAGFDAVRAPRHWQEHEISLLRVMASMVTQMLLRRKDEQALRESEDQLRRNWEFTRTLLNAIPTPVFYMDREGRFIGCNRSYLDFTGRTVETFAGKSVFDLFDLDQAEEHHAKDLELLRTGERQSYEGTMLDMLGRKREVVFNRDVFRNEKGEITGLVGSFIDISRVRKAEQEQREMERQLLHSQKLESLGVLAGGVAHDFNNILLAITGNLELARLDLPEDCAARQAVDDAFLATSRAVDLTRQMLAYSGKGHFVVQDVDINRLITENLAIFKAAVAKNVSFEHELSPDLPPIKADIGQVQQIIMNLITNGSEAVGTKPGSVKITSYVANFTVGELAACRGDVIPEPGQFVVLQVSDTGTGMDTTTLARIFEPFFSTKFTGRGLGMAAVLGILRGHKGGVLIDSRPGEGTRVRILFPAVAPDHPAPETQTASRHVGAARKLHGRILLADDEEEVRHVCTKLLERIGLEVHAVADGVEAVLAVEAQPFGFDLALLDLTMPNMDGLSTLAYLSKHYPKLPVILTSGYTREDVASSGGADTCAGFVQKPFRLEALQAELTRVLTASSFRG